MIRLQRAVFPLIVLCATLTACAGKADKLTDVELARMLHTEGLADERVDSGAVDCLRAWADDSKLTAGLSEQAISESGKSECRLHMQGWLDDGSRNPQGLIFRDVTTPKTAKRAMDLLAALPPLPAQRATASSRPSSTSTTPSTAAAGAASSPQAAAAELAYQEAEYQERVQINNTTTQSIDQLETTCQEAETLAQVRSFNEAELKLINSCKQNVSELRSSLSNVIANGSAFDVTMSTRGAEQALQQLRSVIARSQKK